MRVRLLVLIYFVLCPLAGHYLGLFMIQTSLSGGPANLITMYIVRIVAMILSYLIVGSLLKSLFVPRRTQ
jgi:Ni,Fe-hydrogenase I cytochrome b subunit